jgi:hypothetical protein
MRVYVTTTARLPLGPVKGAPGHLAQEQRHDRLWVRPSYPLKSGCKVTRYEGVVLNNRDMTGLGKALKAAPIAPPRVQRFTIILDDFYRWR